MPSKRAVVVGCNYPGTGAALAGCANDALTEKMMLTQFFGFKEEDIVLMLDTDPKTIQPTGKNIRDALNKMVDDAMDGDILFFHFSGHGTQVPDETGEEDDGLDECLVPCDMNIITDDDLKVIVDKLAQKPTTKFTMVADCCHSGSMLDHAPIDIMIQGEKDPNGPKAPKLQETAELVSALGGTQAPAGHAAEPPKPMGPAGTAIATRALTTDQFKDMLGQAAGQSVDTITGTISAMFGDDATAKLTQQVAENKNVLMVAAAGVALLSSGLIMRAIKAGAQAALSVGVLAAGAAGVMQLVKMTKKEKAAEYTRDVLITGCMEDECSADVRPGHAPNKAFGALTNAIYTIVKAHREYAGDTVLTNRVLVDEVRKFLSKTNISQNPCLECHNSEADEPFVLQR